MSDRTVFNQIAISALLFHLTQLAHFALRRRGLTVHCELLSIGLGDAVDDVAPIVAALRAASPATPMSNGTSWRAWRAASVYIATIIAYLGTAWGEAMLAAPKRRVFAAWQLLWWTGGRT